MKQILPKHWCLSYTLHGIKTQKIIKHVLNNDYTKIWQNWVVGAFARALNYGVGSPYSTQANTVQYHIHETKEKLQMNKLNKGCQLTLILVSNLCNTFNESPCGQFSWTIHRLSIIIWSPGGTVNIDMLRIEAQRSGFHCISNVSIQHPHTCALTVMRLQTDCTLSTDHYTMWTLHLRHLCHPRNRKHWTWEFQCHLGKFFELAFIMRSNLIYAWAQWKSKFGALSMCSPEQTMQTEHCENWHTKIYEVKFFSL